MNDYHEFVGKFSEIAKEFLEQLQEYELLSQIYEKQKHTDYDQKYYFFVIHAMSLEKAVIIIPIQDSYSQAYCETLSEQFEFSIVELMTAALENK